MQIINDEEILALPAVQKIYDFIADQLDSNSAFTDIEISADSFVRVGLLKNLRIPEKKLKLSGDEIDEFVYSTAPDRYKGSEGKLRFYPVRYSFTFNNVGHFRTLVMQTRTGVLVTLRKLSYTIPDYNILGIPPYVRDIFLRGVGVDSSSLSFIPGGMKGGLILITGPMGSGKTTTAASMLKLILDSVPYKVLTIEDPIEYVMFPSLGTVTQLEVGTHIDSQEDGLYHALGGSNASVIFLGETRSVRELQLLLRAAEVGCLTVTSYHVPDAVSAIERMCNELQNEVSIKVLSSVLIGVLNQRLFYAEDSTGKMCFNLVCEWLPVNSLKPVREFIVAGKFAEIRHGLANRHWTSHGAESFEMAIKKLIETGKITSRDLINKFRYSTGNVYEIYG